MREFVIPRDAIYARAEINIAVMPEQAAAVYRSVAQWGQTFPATIQSARVTQAGENWQQIEVTHKQAGRVPNTLIHLSGTEIALEESKPKFDASFLNSFEPGPGGGTRYVIHGYIRPKGIYKLVKPFIKGFVRRQALMQMRRYVLEPLKAAAEQRAIEQSRIRRE